MFLRAGVAALCLIAPSILAAEPIPPPRDAVGTGTVAQIPPATGQNGSTSLAGWLERRRQALLDRLLEEARTHLEVLGAGITASQTTAVAAPEALFGDVRTGEADGAAPRPDGGAVAAARLDACDRLAGSPSDPYAVTDGVEMAEIDAARAIPACREAVERHPQEVRFAFQFGRALSAGGHHEDAAQWYRTAADAGHAAAMNNLGAAYRIGSGVPQDDAESLDWFRRSAAAGEPLAIANVGLMYRAGRGVETDDAEAARWLRRAAEAGQPLAMRLLADAYAEARGVTRDFREAARWYRAAAIAGDTAAMSDLAWAYMQGLGLPQDEPEAARWYRTAAERGAPAAMTALGWLTANGYGVVRDDAEAARWYRTAADLGSLAAMRGLAGLHLSGRGVEKDEVEARGWLRKAAEAGDRDAMSDLGFLIAAGIGGAADTQEAARWILTAVRNGSYTARDRVLAGEGSAELRRALLARLREEGYTGGGTDDPEAGVNLGPAIEKLFGSGNG